MKKIIHFIFSRFFITAVLILLQIGYLTLTIVRFAEYQVWLNSALSLLSLLMTLFILRSDESSPYKLVWILMMTLFPLLGGLLYVFAGNKRPAKKMRNALDKNIKETAVYLKEDKKVTDGLPPRVKSTSDYIYAFGGYPAWDGSTADYFPCGEEFLASFAEELAKAEKYIYLEFFIIAEGKAWDKVWEILLEKAGKGVEIKIIYDDIGSIQELPKVLRDKKNLPENIKAIPFNPFIPLFSVVMNHRDHRKIAVIDGKTAFSGGLNIADEYMNMKVVFGYWKDTAVMIKGSAVRNFTVMFAQMWNSFDADKIDCAARIPADNSVNDGEDIEDIIVQPFGDSPLDNEQVSENVYLDILSQAEKYVYICTPYLVIDDQMRSALTLAAKRGVDVRIITPGIPDKKAVFRVTRSYYQTLISAGVRIYEYTPGFIHAKSYVSDDRTAVVGSINMDFRSLYLHFECGTFITALSECRAVSKLRDDCLDMFERSREIQPDESRRFGRTLFDAVLRALGPLI